MLMMLMMLGMIWNAAHCTRHRDKNTATTLPELGEEKKSRRNGKKKVAKRFIPALLAVRECSVE